MALSRIARQHAAEIRNHDWSDAPFRLDRAGHRRADDGRNRTAEQLSEADTDAVRMNVIWVTAQVLAYNDPNFDVYEFAKASGAPRSMLVRSDGQRNGSVLAGLRTTFDEDMRAAGYMKPGESDRD